MKNTFLYIILICFSLPGCVDEYQPQGIDQTGGFLVVDGIITDGESVFRLSRSVGISTSLDSAVVVTNASLYVETDKGGRIEGRHSERWIAEQDRRSNNPLATVQRLVDQGVYAVPMGALAPDAQYRLHISVDGEEYESAFLKPLDTPKQSPYYRWSFHETWELKSEFSLWGYYPSGIRYEMTLEYLMAGKMFEPLIWFSNPTA